MSNRDGRRSVPPKMLAEAARGGKLSRREVLKRAVAFGLSAPAIAALLAACGGSSSTSSSSTTSSTSAEPAGSSITSAAAGTPGSTGLAISGTPGTAAQASAT
ncbi:MAG TPA: peptide ABC transporter substrate-binding protein, partial [Thermomicrobiaceae bacterium]|nr:peptide ABC transporter substrate-binding protein [Thermomicrobiaceae bacterium]